MITNTGDLNDDETKLEQENPNMETQEGQGKTRKQESRILTPCCHYVLLCHTFVACSTMWVKGHILMSKCEKSNLFCIMTTLWNSLKPVLG